VREFEFTYQGKKELWKGLGKIKTIDPIIKSKKGKFITQVETFSSQKVAELRKKLQLEINTLTAKITEYNNNAELEIDFDLLQKTEKDLFAAA
jgi:predicted acetyltransferase